MQRLIFSDSKRKILEFEAEALNFEQEANGLLISAQGEISFQDSALLEDLTSQQHSCTVAITKDMEEVLNASFQPQFFTLEPDTLIVLLS